MRYVTVSDRTDKSFRTRIYGDRIWEIDFDLRRPVGLESRISLTCDGRERKVSDRNLMEAFRGFGWSEIEWFTGQTHITMYRTAWDLSTWPMDGAVARNLYRGSNYHASIGRMLAVLAYHLPGIEQLYAVGFHQNAIRKIFSVRTEALTMPSGTLSERLGLPNDVIPMLRKDPDSYDSLLTSITETGSISALLRVMERFPNLNRRFGQTQAADILTFATHHGYDLERLYEYLVVECRDYQGIGAWHDAFRLLRDYVRMSDDLGDRIEKYPRSLKRSHDVVFSRHRFKAKEVNAAKFEKVTADESYSGLCGPLPKVAGEYVVLAPTTVADLEFESQQLRHCVVAYARRVAEGETRIYFLREANNPDLPLVTMQVDRGRVQQARGEQNRPVTSEERVAIAAWARVHNLDVPRHLW